MKEVDKAGILCLLCLISIQLLYWMSDINIIVSTILMAIGMLTVGIITSKYQKLCVIMEKKEK